MQKKNIVLFDYVHVYFIFLNCKVSIVTLYCFLCVWLAPILTFPKTIYFVTLPFFSFLGYILCISTVLSYSFQRCCHIHFNSALIFISTVLSYSFQQCSHIHFNSALIFISTVLSYLLQQCSHIHFNSALIFISTVLSYLLQQCSHIHFNSALIFISLTN